MTADYIARLRKAGENAPFINLSYNAWNALVEVVAACAPLLDQEPDMLETGRERIIRAALARLAAAVASSGDRAGVGEGG